jgi:prepilin-type N-terminal cleavage/methylation domain-containing protein
LFCKYKNKEKRGLIPMNYNDVRKNENKGFSLVELIVVIAIMAVLTAVLAPSLLQYVERSRAQKDDSAMGEVTNAILLAMSDQNIYDEVLYYTAYGNYSCYVDGDTATNIETNKTITKAGSGTGTNAKKAQYMYNDDTRMLDETVYSAAGNMRGVTITFQPQKSSNKSYFVLANGIVNKFLQGSTSTSGYDFDNDGTKDPDSKIIAATNITVSNGRNADTVKYVNANPAYATKGNLATMTSGSTGNTYLYNRVRATCGDKIELTSQTYRNSEYTVFIRMGSTGGNQATAQDAITVYGQWNGTNLTAN